jgi:hypothetical protein
MLTSRPDTHPLLRPPRPAFEVVARRVNLAPAVLQPLLDAAEVDGLVLDAPFAVHDTWPAPSWRATGRLSGPRTRIVIDVEPWTDTACQLRLRPVSRRVERWTGRRQRRFFDAAHAAVDDLLHGWLGAAPRPPAQGSVHHLRAAA